MTSKYSEFRAGLTRTLYSLRHTYATQALLRGTDIQIAESLGRSNSSLIVPMETAGLFGAAAAAMKGFKSISQDKTKN